MMHRFLAWMWKYVDGEEPQETYTFTEIVFSLTIGLFILVPATFLEKITQKIKVTK